VADDDIESIPEGSHHSCELEAILEDWQALAATGWEGFVTQGRGCVIVTVNADSVTFDYSVSAPCSCHAHYVEQYDPTAQLVIVVRRPHGQRVHCLSGSPTPPEAFAAATATVQ
jgi:hypothetical protein